MVLRHNFVHADLHPGNVLVEAGAAGAPLAVTFIDAGLAVELSERDRRFVREVLYPWDTALHRVACGGSTPR